MMKIHKKLTALFLSALFLLGGSMAHAEMKKESPDIIIKLRKNGDTQQINLDEHISIARQLKEQKEQKKQTEDKAELLKQQKAAAAEQKKARERERALDEQDRLYAAKLEKEMAETQTLTALDLFNNTLAITFNSATFGISQSQERTFILKYFVDNKGGKPLQLARWTVELKNADNTVFTYDISAPFEKLFLPETRKEVILTLKVKDLPEDVQKLLSDSNVKINVVSIARELVFSDNTKIQVN